MSIITVWSDNDDTTTNKTENITDDTKTAEAEVLNTTEKRFDKDCDIILSRNDEQLKTRLIKWLDEGEYFPISIQPDKNQYYEEPFELLMKTLEKDYGEKWKEIFRRAKNQLAVIKQEFDTDLKSYKEDDIGSHNEGIRKKAWLLKGISILAYEWKLN